MSNLAFDFYQRAQTQAMHPALILEHQSWSYGQMWQSVSQWAFSLNHLCDEHEQYCAILASKSLFAYGGILAISSAGRAYVPLNPNFPTERNLYILQKTALQTLILGEECIDQADALLAECPSLKILILGKRESFFALIEKHGHLHQFFVPGDESISHPIRRAKDAQAYVLFTSGSTGKPKGVLVLERNVRAYLDNFMELYPISNQDRLSQTFDLTFDLSVHDMFVCWRAGATLVPFGKNSMKNPAHYAAQTGLTVWFSVPSTVSYMSQGRLMGPGCFENLRLSLFCGEKLTWNSVDQWRSAAPHSRIVNLYGPTEATIAISHFEVLDHHTEEDCLNGCVPIGQAFPGESCLVGLLPTQENEIGTEGELWLGGRQITAGYFGEAGMTAERFIQVNGKTWYATGDLVKRQSPELIQYVGRKDFQVKVMGYRIELGEIEHNLLKISGATQAVADVREIDGLQELYAVLPSHCKDMRKEIKQRMTETLPSYMVPRKFVFFDDFPLNSNGKIDRKALKSHAFAE